MKFVSEPASSPQLVEVPEEGKAKAKERREVGEGDDTVVVEASPRRTMMKNCCRSASSYGQDSAALDCRTFLLFRISRLAWRLVCPRRQGSRATWPARAWPRS
jgi:hypothetical protein